MPFVPPSPMMLTTEFFASHEHCPREKLWNAAEENDRLKWRPDEVLPTWKLYVREQAREMAISTLWAVIPVYSRVSKIVDACETSCNTLNPFILECERREFIDAFAEEVHERLDMLMATGRK